MVEIHDRELTPRVGKEFTEIDGSVMVRIDAIEPPRHGVGTGGIAEWTAIERFTVRTEKGLARTLAIRPIGFVSMASTAGEETCHQHGRESKEA
jgi:hypothetical protein